jgi:hypothetical protein
MRRESSLSLAFLLTVSGAQAQQPPRTIAGPPACPDCRVHLRRVATLGDIEGPGALAGPPRFVVATPAGAWITAEYPIATRLIVYGPGGEVLREVGRSGSGPGEFSHITAAYLDAEGHLHVFDSSLRRETVFDSTFQVVRIQNIPELRVHEAVPGHDDQPFLNADAGTPEAIGYPIHRVADGRVVRSFGSPAAVQRPDAPWLGQRAMAPTREGLWIARRTHYWLEKWTADGSLLDVIERRAGWFDPYLMRDRATPEAPPKPWVSAIRLTGQDTLLVLLSVAAPEFADRVTIRHRTPSITLYDLSPCRELFDTRVELIDLASGRLLLSDRVDDCLHGFVGEKAYASRIENGIPKVDIFELSYRPPAPGSMRRIP